MLGGNSEFLAKQEMRKNKFSEELITEATSFYETEDVEILEARRTYIELEEKYLEEIKAERNQVIGAGGLKIIGTERHESRRIDNQLRGRSGRQGDPGESRFYISLDDDLMKIFGGDMITSVYDKLGVVAEDTPIEFPIITSAIERAQKRVEGRNFSIRKHVLQYDDVMNVQRGIIYNQRRQVLDGEDIKNNILTMMNSIAEEIVSNYLSGIHHEEEFNVDGINSELKKVFGIGSLASLKSGNLNIGDVSEELKEKAHEIYEQKEKQIGEQELRKLERVVMLRVVDQNWMDHIDNMDRLKEGIGLRAYGQKDPVVEYRMEGADAFDEMVAEIKYGVITFLFNAEKAATVVRKSAVNITGAGLDNSMKMNTNLGDGSGDGTSEVPKQQQKPTAQPIRNENKNVGRNAPCPCGSGKKYKQCCGK